jgi:hypothetical protein
LRRWISDIVLLHDPIGRILSKLGLVELVEELQSVEYEPRRLDLSVIVSGCNTVRGYDFH